MLPLNTMKYLNQNTAQHKGVESVCHSFIQQSGAEGKSEEFSARGKPGRRAELMPRHLQKTTSGANMEVHG